MQKISLLLLIFILFCSSLSAQLYMSGNATGRIDSLINKIPATSFTDEYKPPDPEQGLMWSEVVFLMLNGDLISAHAAASEIGYRIIVFSDTLSAKTYYFLEMHPDSRNYWGTFVFNPNPLRSKLVIQVPHPLGDTYTGRQGFYIFKQAGAFLYCVSGTHRCNSSDSTSCSGRTDVCYGLIDARFRKSDQAHSIESVFQITTEVLLKHQAEMVFIQPHGFSRQNGDPDLILSNGTRYTPRIDYLASLKDSMLLLNPLLTFKLVHLDWNWYKLTGLTNTQGRAVNMSVNPCYYNSQQTVGRFLHIEQAPFLRYPKYWYLLTNSIMKVFPADYSSVELAYMKASQEKENIVIEWQTSEENQNHGFELQKQYGNSSEWNYIAFIPSAGSHSYYRYTDNTGTESSIMYRLKQISNDGSIRLLPPVNAQILTVYSFILYDNYPNPFNPSTTISFEIPYAAEVELSIYNILGERIQILMKGVLQQGFHKVQFNSGEFPAGVYFYRLNSDTFSSTKKLLLLK